MSVFEVGRLVVRVWKVGGRWRVAVGDSIHRDWFMSEARASAAGLLRAQHLRAQLLRANAAPVPAVSAAVVARR